MRRMNGSNARADTYLYLLDYPLSKFCEYLAWNVLGGRQQWSRCPKSFEAPGGTDASTLACRGMLVGRENLEAWNVNRKPSAGILRAWVRSEPPALTWLLLGFNFGNFGIYEEICT